MTKEIKLSESLSGATTKVIGKKWRAKIIEANRWGSSAYYPAEVLERDGSRVFTNGLAMYANHPKESEEWERPERSIHDMVGKLISDALYEAEGPEGPGLYADVEFYDSFLSEINEKHQDVGLSVRASGLTEDGEMDGRFGPILQGLLSAKSVDVVTKAGAGGKLTSILESDREPAGRPIEIKEGSSVDVTKEDFEAFKTELSEAISGLGATITASIAEALQPAVVEGEVIVEAKAEKTEAVVIDHGAIVEALRNESLPAVAAGAIIKSLEEGKTLEESIAAQVSLREAYAGTAAEVGVVHIQESKGETKKTGLAAAVDILG